VPPTPAAASPLLLANLARLRDAATRGPIVDLACGRGRHVRAVAALGLPVVGIDRDAGFLRELAAAEPGVALVRSDLETPAGLPLRPGSCGAILVFRYLHRPLAPAIEAALAPGGLLLYETFTTAQATLENGPSNPRFLLEEGELRDLFRGLRRLGYEEAVRRAGERGEARASLVARRPG